MKIKYVLTVLLLLSIIFNLFIYGTKKTPEYKSMRVVNDIKLTDKNILNELIENRCILPNVALAIAKNESGHKYNSNLAVNAKNIFGIKHHTSCKYVSGSYNGYASYSTYKDNIACFCHIQERFLKCIHNNYAEDPLYVQKLRNIKSSNI